MTSRLNDMQDWDLLLTGKFVKRQKNFNLKKKLKEIEEVMNYRANINNKVVTFVTNFSDQKDLASSVKYDELL